MNRDETAPPPLQHIDEQLQSLRSDIESLQSDIKEYESDPTKPINDQTSDPIEEIIQQKYGHLSYNLQQTHRKRLKEKQQKQKKSQLLKQSDTNPNLHLRTDFERCPWKELGATTAAQS